MLWEEVGDVAKKLQHIHKAESAVVENNTLKKKVLDIFFSNIFH